MQLNFFDVSSDSVVNVASVKHRSPFRYPGGKTWLIPRIYQWLKGKPKPAEFIEPFCGGAIVGLTVAFEMLASHVILVEMDAQVAAVWKTILTYGDGEWLAKKIIDFPMSVEAVNDVLTTVSSSNRDLAFQTIIQNRTAHGGILAKGAGLLKYGENGKGVNSRWYPKTLASRIIDIDRIRNRIAFIHGDAFEVIEANKEREDVVFFLDPPYTAGKGKRAGSRLYTHFEIDHERLFALMGTVKGDFLITYDNDKDVKDLAEMHGFVYKEVTMQNTHLSKMTELLIGRNLDWVK